MSYLLFSLMKLKLILNEKWVLKMWFIFDVLFLFSEFVSGVDGYF